MSAGGSGGGGGGEDKDSYALLWMFGLLFVVMGIVWHFWGSYLKLAFIAVKRYEMLAISFFVNNENVQRALQGLSLASPDNIDMNYANVISTFIGQYLMYPIIFLLVVMALVMFKGSVTMRFTKAYNMDMLAEQEKKNYPQIAPVVDLDLIEQDVDKGPWAMSQNPMEFARANKLLKVELVADRKAAWKAEGVAKATLLKEKAAQVFSSQLGPLWTGVNGLPPHAKALYAAFAARMEHDTDSCRGYLQQLSAAAAKGNIDYSRTDELIKKYGGTKAVQMCQTRHAYNLTLMATMLSLARVDGVLASCDFLWIKPIDRRLWYTLNCVGRQVAISEVGGIMAHWIAEKEMARPLSVPMVEEAVKALDFAVANIIYTPEEGEVVKPSEG
jgi:intracellular multiplication protein IcmP